MTERFGYVGVGTWSKEEGALDTVGSVPCTLEPEHREYGGYGTVQYFFVIRDGRLARGRDPVWVGSEQLFRGKYGTIVRQS